MTPATGTLIAAPWSAPAVCRFRLSRHAAASDECGSRMPSATGTTGQWRAVAVMPPNLMAPTFSATDFAWYETVNRRFAEAIADEAVVPEPIVFAHDYHFAFAAALVRRALPLSRIATFWHPRPVTSGRL